MVKERIDSDYKGISDIKHFGAKLNHDFFSKDDKLGAIYYWICTNVEIDVKKYFSKNGGYTYNFKYKTREEKVRKIQETDNKMALEAFRSKKATGKEYAHMFKKMCDNAGIECEVISGCLKSKYEDIGRKPGRSDHLWNAVKIDGKWHLIDSFWGAGYLNEQEQTFTKQYSERFYMLSPEEFFLNHFPKRTQWVLVDRSPQEFEALPLFHYQYFFLNMNLLIPAKGIVSVVSKGKISVVFKEKGEGINTQDLFGFSYGFEKDETLAKIIPFKKGEYVKFQIPVPDLKHDYFSIYFKGQPVVTYKIKLPANTF